ncbi:hypothetical protein CYMTET_34543 [Cymbomonas tetramitiformis]|uniref:Uncharacterized protein n=1 Tax=Cymbomonas tetramitiformis TaxID=36881 RepID=A0AAE0FB11_9CHLO|nr:hypothetical protein CYMTET_34543 [Cymbomonas tetramitiformis]|eukprot:gene3328-biopygen3280
MSGEDFSNLKDFPHLPKKPGESTDKVSTPDPSPSKEDLLRSILHLQRQQAEEQRLLREQLRRQAVINESLEAQIAAAAAKPVASDTGGGATRTAEQLLERRRKLAYVREAKANPFPRRPASLTPRVPQMYDLHGNKTCDALAKKSNSSMKYESLVLGPSMSYLYDVVAYGNISLDSAEAGDETLETLHQRLHEMMNSVQGVYSMLSNRWTMLELRAQLEADPSSSQRGGAEALCSKLQFVEDRVYSALDGIVADEVLQQWLDNFDKSRGTAMLNTTSKLAANAETGGGRWKPPDKGGGRHKDDKHEDKKPLGKGGEGGRGAKPAADG